MLVQVGDAKGLIGYSRPTAAKEVLRIRRPINAAASTADLKLPKSLTVAVEACQNVLERVARTCLQAVCQTLDVVR